MESHTDHNSDKTQLPAKGDGQRQEQISQQANGDAIKPGAIKADGATSSKQMEEQKLIPKLELTDKSKPDTAKKDWTVAVELGASMPGNATTPGGWGVDRELGELKKLARETEGKSVDFVVHAERPVDSKGKLCDQGEATNTSKCTTDAIAKNRAVTERYFIHDGKIDRLPDAKYKNVAEDMTALLHETKAAPADKLGLIIQSHGIGKSGIATNLGMIPLDQTVNSIKNGLKNTGHDKLDLLDYNSCDMADAKVLQKSGSVAKDVVASAAEEAGSASNDGQNMPEAMRALMGNSKMSGRDLGETIVGQAQAGLDGKDENGAIATLTNFDMSKQADFTASLDRFGAALTATAGNGDNMKQMQAAIESTTIPFTGGQPEDAHNRDLRELAQTILKDAQDHKFKGDTTALEASASDFLKSMDSFATKHYGEKEDGYDKIGGLTAFLPGSEVLDSKTLAQELSPINQMDTTLKEALDPQNQQVTTDNIMERLNNPLQMLEQGWSKRFPQELKSLETAKSAIEAAPDDAARRTALSHMKDLSAGYASGPVGAQTMKDMEVVSRFVQDKFNQQPIDAVAPGWDKFVKLVESQAK